MLNQNGKRGILRDVPSACPLLLRGPFPPAFPLIVLVGARGRTGKPEQFVQLEVEALCKAVS
jgi:hypothetical protein